MIIDSSGNSQKVIGLLMLRNLREHIDAGNMKRL